MMVGLEIKCPKLSTHIGYLRAGKLPHGIRSTGTGLHVYHGAEVVGFYELSP